MENQENLWHCAQVVVATFHFCVIALVVFFLLCTFIVHLHDVHTHCFRKCINHNGRKHVEGCIAQALEVPETHPLSLHSPTLALKYTMHVVYSFAFVCCCCSFRYFAVMLLASVVAISGRAHNNVTTT